MKYDAISFVPDRQFRPEILGKEFEIDRYCLNLDGAFTLHLKSDHLNQLLGDTPSERRQLRKWYFYTAHLNCLYLLLDSFVVRELNLGYFDFEEVTTRNADVLSGHGVSISPRSHRTLLRPRPHEQLVIPDKVICAVEEAFRVATREVERVYVLSELSKSLASYKSTDFTTSMVLSWFLIEGFIEGVWARYLDEHELKNGPKRKTLFAKLEDLKMKRKFSPERFSEVNLLRKVRNNIVHPNRIKNERPEAGASVEDCGRAFDLLRVFLQEEFGLQLTLNLSYSQMGVFER